MNRTKIVNKVPLTVCENQEKRISEQDAELERDEKAKEAYLQVIITKI